MRNIILKTSFLLAVLAITITSIGQNRMVKRLEKGQIEKVEKQTLKILNETPQDVDALFAYSLLLSTSSYNKYNLENAYQNSLKLRTAYKSLKEEKAIKKLNENDIDEFSIELIIKNIIDSAFNSAKTNNEISGFKHFLDYYTEADEFLKKESTNSIHNLAFENASKLNTINDYQDFINNYPLAKQIPQAKIIRNQLAFDKAKSENSIESYQYFITKFPDAIQIKKAVELRDEKAYEKATSTNTKESYNNFLYNYPSSHLKNKAKEKIEEFEYEEAKSLNTSDAYLSFLNKWPKSKFYDTAFYTFEALQYKEQTVDNTIEDYKYFISNYPSNSFIEVAEDSLYHIALRNKDLNNLEFCIDLEQGNFKDSALISYYKIYTDDGEKRTLNKFIENFRKKENINESLLDSLGEDGKKLAELGDQLYLISGYSSYLFSKYDEYIKLAAPNERAFLALQKMISDDIEKKNWANASKTVSSYLPYFRTNRKKIDNLLAILNKPTDPNIKIYNMGTNINTIVGGEYTPVISADDKYFYFCGRDRSDLNKNEDIFVSKKGPYGFSLATPVASLNNNGTNQAPLSISADGTEMILFVDGKLKMAEKNIYNQWEVQSSFPETINSGKWQADARITSDKKALIFSSIRSTNYDYYPEDNLDNYHGNRNYPSDIYVSIRDEEDNWGEPINLGPTINTIYADRSPFLHPDMKTLYFASDGHGGLGSYDLFKSTRLYDSCWDCWSEPVNLGKEFNTNNGDWGLDISTDGDKAFMSKGINAGTKNVLVKNDNDIFWSKVPTYLRPDYVATINGKLLDSKNQPVVANIRWEDLEAKKLMGIAKSDPEDGSYFIVLPLGKLYGYYVDDDNLFPIANSLDLRDFKKQLNINNDIRIITYEDMLDNKVSASMNNIFFKTGSSSLESTSLPELKRIATIIKEKNIKINIIGHTDNIGTDANNLVLSLERANTIKQILMKEGCNEEDVITKGMGESMPIASNDTEAGRAKNRRVEIIFEKK
jgi:outer membrane protein OmpA-like peptidoglycan-associated protein